MRGELNRLNHLACHHGQYHDDDDDDDNYYDDDDDDGDDNYGDDNGLDLLLCHLCKHSSDCCSLQLGPLLRRSVGCLLIIIMILIPGYIH